MDESRYPIGYYRPPEAIDANQVNSWIDEIAALPDLLQSATNGLTSEERKRKYREGSWTIQQVVYHLGDSHLNSYVRFKWALTESTPLIKAYDEKLWAETADSFGDLDEAVSFLHMLHKRWVNLLRSISSEQWDRTFQHPETGKEISLRKNVGLYAWHGKHHLAHIKNALEANPPIF